MPIRQGYEAGAVLQSGQITNGLSSDLNDYQFDEWNPSAFMVCDRVEYDSGSRFGLLCARSAATAKTGYRLLNWADDFYDHIYITPTFIDLGTIASPQTRTVELWNAWRGVEASLASIDVNGTPVVVDGNLPPYDFRPLQYGTYTITVPSTGTPSVNAEVMFNFSNVPDPAPVVIIGTRAVRFGLVPEVPVREVWGWNTDLMRATDGTEQRIAVRGEVPRVVMELDAVFVDQEDIDEFYSQLLTAAGRLWVPEYQYATQTTAGSAAGTNDVFYDTAVVDIRPGEYALIDTKANVFMAEVLAINSGSLTLLEPLDFPVPKGSIITSGAPCLLDDASGLDRMAVDWAATTSLKCRMQRYRTTLTRPGAPAQLATYKGSAVLERRPLAPDTVRDSFYTGQEDVDNDTGVFDLYTNWDYTRIGGARQFKVNRVKEPLEMDYWREFFAWCRGMARMFWFSTYRKDLTFLTAPLAGATVASFVGNTYALKLFGVPTHRHIEVETAAGTHRFEVENCVDDAGNSAFNMTPAWPIGDGWQEIRRVSLLLPCRLDRDEVSWNHYGLESLLDMSIRTAEDQDP